MPIRPQVEIDKESGIEAFESALSEQDLIETEEEQVVVESSEEVDDPEIEIVEGEVPKEEEPASKVDTESNLLERLVDVLGENKAKPVAPTVKARAELPTVDRAEIRKTFNEKLHETDDPYALFESTAQSLVGNELAKQNLEIQGLKKAVLKNDPVNAIVFENWDDEIENVISDLPAGQQNHPDAYQYAVEKIRNVHFLELVSLEADKKIAAKVRPGKTVTLGQTQGVTTAKKKPKKVYASQRDKQMAKSYGLSLKAYLQSQDKI